VTWPDRVEVKDVTAVLAERSAAGALTFQPKPSAEAYAFHDACHAPRIRRNAAAPRALLKAVLGDSNAKELFWRADRAQPCGAIGGLEFINPEIASLMAAARWEDARATGAVRLISDDPTCFRHLSERPASGLKIESLFTLLSEAIAP
jgi:Fe-S oxidoreductase